MRELDEQRMDNGMYENKMSKETGVKVFEKKAYKHSMCCKGDFTFDNANPKRLYILPLITNFRIVYHDRI
jgi:hypothetical protein